MRYPASKKLEIIRLTECLQRPAKWTLDKLGVPRRIILSWQNELADRLSYSEVCGTSQMETHLGFGLKIDELKTIMLRLSFPNPYLIFYLVTRRQLEPL